MKIKIIFLLLISTSSLIAQKTEVTEVIESIGGGSNPGYSIFIEHVDPDRAEKEWKNLIKDYNGRSASAKALKDQVVFENVKIAAVSTEPLKVYAKLVKDKNAIRITAAFAKPGSFISSSNDPSAHLAVEKVMYNFAVNFKKKLVSEEIDLANQSQRKNREKMKSLQKNIDGNQKEISLYENKITTARQEITRDSTFIEQLKIQIASQDSTLQMIKQHLREID